MKSWIGIRGVLFGVVVALVSMGHGRHVSAAKQVPVVGIIQYVEHQALDRAREGFLAALTANGYCLGQDVEIDYQNAQGDASNLSTISDRFVGRGVDLVLAIATPAAQSIAAKTAQIPILGTAITDYVAARLVNSNARPGGNVSGTSDMNPVKEQIELIVKLAPGARTIGVLYTSSEDNSVLQARIAKEVIEALGRKCVEATVSNSNEVFQATQSIVRRVDGIYIPTDNIFATAMPLVYSVTSRAKIPVVPGEAGMAKAGGLATLAVDYYDLGYQTGLMAVRVLEGEDIAAMPIETAARFDYFINGPVAAAMGITIPPELEQYVLEDD